MTLEQDFGIIDFANGNDRGIGLLSEWLKYSPNVTGLIQAIMPEVQEIHDSGSDVYSSVNIFDAVGTQLDDIFGNILDTPRDIGQTDDNYRLELLAASSRLARSGEIGVMKGIFRNLLGATFVRLYEYQPAAFRMNAVASSVPTSSQLSLIRSNLEQAKQGGNSMALAVTDQTNIFTLANLTSQQLNSSSGLNGSSFSGGGYLLQGF